jgi:hypothetical protein
LCRLAVGLLWLSEDMGIEELDNLLEAEEFGHRVQDLTREIRKEIVDRREREVRT